MGSRPGNPGSPLCPPHPGVLRTQTCPKYVDLAASIRHDMWEGFRPAQLTGSPGTGQGHTSLLTAAFPKF